MNEVRTHRPRVVVLTALEVEARAVLARLGESTRERTSAGDMYRLAQLPGSGEWVAVFQIGMGNATSAAATMAAIREFSPAVIAFVGVAGGVKDASLGDVVIADKVYGYEQGKESDDGFLSRPDTYRVSAETVDMARDLAREVWNVQAPPHVYVGPIAAGERLVATKRETASLIRERFNDCLALEMEGVGFLAAAWRGHGQQAVLVRGISDLLEGKAKADATGSQSLASENAAKVALDLVRELLNSAAHEVDPGARDGRRASFLPPRPGRLSGRDSELTAMTVGFERPTARTVITGIPGVGKSALAAEYAHAVLADPSNIADRVVWWVSAASVAAGRAGLAALGRAVGDPSGHDDDSALDVAMALLAQSPDVLLIVDGVTDPSALSELLPGHIAGRLLVTSVATNWDATFTKVALSVLDEHSAVDLLTSGLIPDGDPLPVVDALGRLPLALRQANAYMAESGMPLSRYHAALDEYLPDLLDLGEQVDHPGTVFATVSMACEVAANASETAVLVLLALSSFGDSAVPVTRFVTGAIDLEEEWSEVQVYADIALLRRLGLVEVSGSVLRMHRLTSEVARTITEPDVVANLTVWAAMMLAGGDTDESVATPLREAVNRFPSDQHYLHGLVHRSLAGGLLDMNLLNAALDEARSARDAAGPWLDHFGFGRDDPSVMPPRGPLNEEWQGVDRWMIWDFMEGLCGIEGQTLYQLQRYDAGVAVSRLALYLAEGLEEPERIARAHNNLGSALLRSGDSTGSYEHARLAERFQREAGGDPTLLVRRLTHSAQAAEESGDLQTALSHLDSAIDEARNCGRDDADLRYQVAHAISLRAEWSDVPAAELLAAQQSELATAREASVPTSILAVITNNLALTTIATGDIGGGLALLQESLDLAVTTWGEQHEETTTRRMHIARYNLDRDLDVAREQIADLVELELNGRLTADQVTRMAGLKVLLATRTGRDRQSALDALRRRLDIARGLGSPSREELEALEDLWHNPDSW